MNCVKCCKRPATLKYKSVPVCDECIAACHHVDEYERQIGRTIVMWSILTPLILIFVFALILLSVAFVLM